MNTKVKNLLFKFPIVIAVLVCLSFASASALAAEEFAGGSGTEEDPYLIETTEQLNNVRNDLSAHYKMIADIEFTEEAFDEDGAFYNDGAGWIPIGDATVKFKGVFDGNDYAVIGLYQNISKSGTAYGGLFGYVYDATIQNVDMEDSDIKVTSTADSAYAGSAHAGGIAGYARDSSIINCYNKGIVMSTGRDQSGVAGGIVGGSYDSNISNCCNMGEVTASAYGTFAEDYAGGIVGEAIAYFGDNITISNCCNTGNITSTDYTGGIVGIADTSTSDITINNCYNTGDITPDADTWGRVRVGGIAGYASEYTRISDSYNAGEITLSFYDVLEVYVGGIAGYSLGTIRNCFNTVSITVNNRYTSVPISGTKWTYVGGILGSTGFGTIRNCYNTGAISLSAPERAYAGGVVGTTAEDASGRKVTISNCYNTGMVTADHYAGGISGVASQTTTISNCYNTRKVTATHAGGIAGSSHATITNCYYRDICSGVGYGTDTAVKCSIEQMHAQSTFVGFDFTETWTMSGNEEYLCPELLSVPHVGKEVIDTGNTTEFAGGFGVAANPYLIETKEHLNNVRKDLSAHYKMIADVKFTSADSNWVAIGNMDAPFTGTFDGNNYTISGLRLNQSNLTNCCGGLFGVIENATVKNIGMVESSITYSTSAFSYAGGIVGRAIDSKITNCYNTGLVTARVTSSSAGGSQGTYHTAFAGGIIGSAENSTITQCYNLGAVTALYAPSLNYVDAGGIAGYLSGCTTEECYNTGTISAGYGFAGGIGGYVTSGLLCNSFNTGAVTAERAGGGIVGGAYGNITIADVYNIGPVSTKSSYSVEASLGGIAGTASSAVISGYYLDNCGEGIGGDGEVYTVKCTEAQMERQGTFDFYFDDIWTMEGNEAYPYPELIALPLATKPASISISAFSATNAKIAIEDNTSGRCYVAVYNSDGKMLSYGVSEVKPYAGEVTVSFMPFDTDSADTVNAFLVDSQGRPACESAKYWYTA